MVLGYKKVVSVLLLMLNIGPEGNKSMTQDMGNSHITAGPMCREIRLLPIRHYEQYNAARVGDNWH